MYAASQTADLSGTVRDSSGTVIPKATITITNENTGLNQETLSEEQGFYRFAFLLPGSYTITATARGFAFLTQPSVKLDPDQKARVDLMLLPASVKESVTVRGSASSVQTESPAVATEVDSELIRDSPVNGRSFQGLIALAPGVSFQPVITLSHTLSDPSTAMNVNGQRDTANYFSVDGVSVNVAIAASPFGQGPTPGGVLPVFDALGSTHGMISMDDIQEFKVQTSTYTAEIGRAGGGQLVIVSRSGSNGFHGSVFDYFRNEALDANDWFANAHGFPRAALRQNDFGGFFGGPILQDRMFFFFSYEGLRAQLPTTLKTAEPSLAARRAATGPIQQLLNAFPLPNGPEDPASMLAIRTNTYFDSPSLDNTSIRIDHAVNERLTVFGRYSEAPSGGKGSGAAGSEVGSGTLNFRSATLGATLVLSTHTASDLRLNYSRTEATASDALASLGGAVAPPNSLLFPPFASPSSSRIFVSMGGPHFALGRLADSLQRQGNIVSNTSVIRGSHEVKFGADYRYLAPHYGPFKYRESIFFGDVPTALSGIAQEVDVDSFDSVTLGIHNLSLYGQDSWKINPTLTLTYGLRWELVPPPHATGGQQLFTLTGLPTSQFPHFRHVQLAPPGTPLYKTSYTNFAPRVGAAYQLLGTRCRETVIRGGFGIYYDLGVANATDAAAFPHRLTKMVFGVPYPLTPDVTAPPAPANFRYPSGTFVVFGPDHALPRSYQWNATIDQRLGSNQVLSTSYVAEVGRRLLRSTYLQDFGNRYLGPSQIFLTSNHSSSDYQALQIQFRRRFSRGLAALLSYVWSHSIDDTSTDVGNDNLVFPCYDPPCNDRGPSDFDVRNAFKAAFTYEIPARLGNAALHAILNNWSIASIYTVKTALPVNVTVGRGDIGGDPSLFVTRPDLAPDVPLYIHNSTLPGGERNQSRGFFCADRGSPGRSGTQRASGIRFHAIGFCSPAPVWYYR